MAATVLGTTLSVLLLASISQGLRDVEVLHSKTVETTVGQNITLPCLIKNTTDLKLVHTEWSKRGKTNSKLAVYVPGSGIHLVRPNVAMQIKEHDEDMLMGSYLHLQRVDKSDSGVYVCDITTFPMGSLRGETEVKVEDAPKITCDMNGNFEVNSGENVTIHCTALSGAHYTWTKDEKLVAERESLELRWVTAAHAGVYTLTVNAGNQSFHTEFNLTVLTGTTSSGTGFVTGSPQFNVTDEGLNQTTSSFTTSPTTEHPTTDTNVTMFTFPNVTGDTPDPYNATAMTDEEISPTVSLHTSPNTDQSGPSNRSTTLSHGSSALGSTQGTITDETKNVSSPSTAYPENESVTRPEESSSTLGNVSKNSEDPGATSTLSAGDTTGVNVERGAAGVQSRVLLALIILPVLVFIILAGFLYKRHILRQRMDMPPSFKPPPPPVKYSSVKTADPLTSSGCYTT